MKKIIKIKILRAYSSQVVYTFYLIIFFFFFLLYDIWHFLVYFVAKRENKLLFIKSQSKFIFFISVNALINPDWKPYKNTNYLFSPLDFVKKLFKINLSATLSNDINIWSYNSN